MLDALQLLRYVGAGFWPLLLQSLCLLLQDRQPHGDVKPIEEMLAERVKILLYSANIFASVGHEYHLLIFLHSLRFHQLPETPAWFLVVGLHKAKTLRRGYLSCILAPKCNDTPAGDHFKTSLFMRCSNVAAIDARRDRAVRQRLLLPVVFRAFILIQLPLIAQFLLDPFRRRLHVVADTLLIHGVGYRQYIHQQISHFCEGDQRCPLALQIEHFYAGSPLKPCSRRPECLRALSLAGASVPPWIRNIYPAEESLHTRASRALRRMPATAMETSPPLLQILANLLCDHIVLYAFKQRFALSQVHAEGLHRQLLALNPQHLPALFAAVGTHAHHLDANHHAQNSRRDCVNFRKRSLAS